MSNVKQLLKQLRKQPDVDLDKGTILIVEDSALVSEMLRRFVNKMGHPCLQVDSLAETKKLNIVEENIFIAIVDFQLLDCTAYEILAELRKQNSSIATVVVSASEEDLAVHAKTLRPTLFLPKPIPFSVLQIALANAWESYLRAERAAKSRSSRRRLMAQEREIITEIESYDDPGLFFLHFACDELEREFELDWTLGLHRQSTRGDWDRLDRMNARKSAELIHSIPLLEMLKHCEESDQPKPYRYQSLIERGEEQGPGMCICLPITDNDGSSQTMIIMGREPGGDEFSPQCLELVQDIVQIISLCFNNIKMYAQPKVAAAPVTNMPNVIPIRTPVATQQAI